MQIKILAMNPTAADGRGATAIEKAVNEEGYRMHGTPVVFREQLVQVLVKDDKGK